MRLSPTPYLSAALLACAVAPAAHALSISDDDFVLSVGIDAQAQQSMANGRDAAGTPYDVVQDRDGRSDQLNSQERRARFFVYGSYDTAWKFFLGYLDDNADSQGYKSTASGVSGGSRLVQLYKAWIERDLKMGASLVSTLHAGVDYPFYNIAIQGDPNWLFCNQRATGTLGNIRGEGLRYKLGGDSFTWGFDLMHNMDSAKPAAEAFQRDGLFYSSRIEIFPLGGPKPAYKESYAGQRGHSLMLAADVGYDDHDLGYYNTTGPVANYRTSSLGYGFETIYHHDQLSALAEYRMLNTHADSLSGGPDLDNRSRIWLIQAGWTFTAGNIGIEPALRYTSINYDLGSDVAEAYDATAGSLGSGSANNVFGISTGDADSGLSGHQIDAGVNLYFVKHIIEMQIDYSYWRAEAGQGKANILRVQEQVAF